MNKEKGVSPVIATVLMVAITVVLVVTIYVVVVTNMLTTPYSTQQFICTLSEEPSSSTPRSVVFSVALRSPSQVSFDRVRIGIMHNGKYVLLNYSAAKSIWTNYTSGDSWHFEAKIYDNDNNNKLDTGDEIEISIVGDKSPTFISGDSLKVGAYGYNGIATGDITA